MELFTFLFSCFIQRIDPVLISWIGVVFVYGYWIKKLDLPAWVPKIPTQIIILLFVAFSVFGYMTYRPDSIAEVMLNVVGYGAINAFWVAGMAIMMYDIRHQRKKAKAAAKAEGGPDEG